MIKIQIKEGGRLYDIPESLDEITFETYLQIIQGFKEEHGDSQRIIKNKIHALQVLLDESVVFVEDLDLSIFNLLSEHIAFISTLPEPSPSITVKGGIYTCKNESELPLRDYINADLKAKENDLAGMLAQVCKNFNNMSPTREQILQEPASNILPALAFFLLCENVRKAVTLISSALREEDNTAKS